MLNISSDFAQTPPKKRSKNDGSASRDGATVYKRPLHSVAQTNYHTIYLSENKTLSTEQNTKFFQIVAMLQQQNVQPFHMAREVVDNWNYQHSMCIPWTDTGLGGEMREGHAKKIFETVHKHITKQHIIQQTAAPTTTKTTTTKTTVPVKIPTKDMIQKMSSRDLKEHIRPIRYMTICSSVKINKQKLTDYYYPDEK